MVKYKELQDAYLESVDERTKGLGMLRRGIEKISAKATVTGDQFPLIAEALFAARARHGADAARRAASLLSMFDNVWRCRTQAPSMNVKVLALCQDTTTFSGSLSRIEDMFHSSGLEAALSLSNRLADAEMAMRQRRM